MADMVGLMGDLGGTAVADEPIVQPVETPGEAETPLEEVDTVTAPEGESTLEPGDVTPGAEEEHPEGELPKPEAVKEMLPAALAKTIRELKAAHPEQAPALKALNDAYYASRAYKQIYASPDEARTDKAAIEALGGHDGIAQMRREIVSIGAFDKMAAEGDPRVIEGLATEFPDGFKMLVAPTLERLRRMDPEAYRETMRDPFLQVLEGDGVIDVIGNAMEELKAGNADRATRELQRIAQWYTKLKEQDKEFKGRYQDPRLQDLQRRETQVTQQKSDLMRTHVTRELGGYLKSTMNSPLANLTKNVKISEEGRRDLEDGITQEVYRILGSNNFYRQSVKDLMAQGDIDRVVAFAKPYVDQARRTAVNNVWTRRYGTMPASPKAPVRKTAPVIPAQPPKASDTAIPIARKPQHDEIDWSKPGADTLFITGKGFLKGSGKFVTWKVA